MKGLLPFMLLIGAWGLSSQALAASEQAIRDCQASSMNPLVVSACIKKLTSKAGRLKDIQCSKDLECWGKQNEARAQRNCAPGFSRAAQWDANWWKLWDEQELTHVRWRSRREGTLEYYVDSGGMRLICGFDPELPQRVQVQYGPAVGDLGLKL
jgi:hypothetical protein